MISISRCGLGAAIALVVAAAHLSSAAETRSEQLSFHDVRTDEEGRILPWHSADRGEAYDHVLRLVWEFWRDMKACPNGVKYSLQHQVWAHPLEDARGLGGDQLSMALSSWSLLYPYLGDPAVLDDMVLIADHWLANGLSPSDALWPDLPFPYNTELHSGVYDGDMRAGKGVLQPDKAGNFGAELIVLYQITGRERYLGAAVRFADVLAERIEPGDADRSPWPFRVNAYTGEVAGAYTANWTGALRMFDGLIALGEGDVAAYERARGVLSAWLRQQPLRTNKWGPFFEDVPGWSDTETNADTFARYLLEHPEWDSRWRERAGGILAWSRAAFGNPGWAHLGVLPINEQTAYLVPGNSHTARHASVQLIYAEKTGDRTLVDEAFRQLDWATYMVGRRGENCYFLDNVWLTDGYGDYVRHYLRAMAAAPELAPEGQTHLLRWSSPVTTIQYEEDAVRYETFAEAGREVLRLAFGPTHVLVDGEPLPRVGSASELDHSEGYAFEADGDPAGVLRIRRDHGRQVEISSRPRNRPPHVVDVQLQARPGVPLPITLDASDDGPAAALTFRLGGPYHGKLSGTAPHLIYTPSALFVGTDVLTYTAHDGVQESPAARVVIAVTPDPTSHPTAPPEIEYATESQIVAEGDAAQFGVRLEGTAPVRLQWQRSRDGGQTWTDIPGATSVTHAVTEATRKDHDGALFRCVARNEAPGQTVSRSMSLEVRPAGSGPFNHSRWMLDCTRPAEPRPGPGLPDCELILAIPKIGDGGLGPRD